jgi:hypothetical protein
MRFCVYEGTTTLINLAQQNGGHAHYSNQDNDNGTTNETSDKIIGKAGNGMRQARTHT